MASSQLVTPPTNQPLGTLRQHIKFEERGSVELWVGP